MSLMMYISPALLLIFYGHIGFSDASPPISLDDASPRSSRKTGAASFHTDTPRISPESSGPPLGPAAAPPADPTANNTAPTLQPPTTAPAARIMSAAEEPTAARGCRLTGPRKGRAVAPEKMLQTMMVSVGSTRTDNDAWAADATTGPSSAEQQGEEMFLHTFTFITGATH